MSVTTFIFRSIPGHPEAEVDVQPVPYPRGAFVGEGSWLVRGAGTIPEPGGLILLSIGIFGVWVSRRKSKRGS
ncbi:MAG: PEP-CTERM sorting domain-containing protein [Betaproteobacteria bacterium]